MILQKRDRLINIYTDGACFGNPGPGGWAFIYYINDIKIQNSGGEPLTTNNRMELVAVIKALKEVTKFSNVVIFSDSKYVVEGATKWINNWRKNNWKNSKRELIKNFDLWTKLDQIVGHYRRYEIDKLKALCNKSGFQVIRLHYSDCLGFFTTLTWKFLNIFANLSFPSRASLVFYDNLIFPISRFLDNVGFKYLLGKNIILVAKKKNK